MSHTSEHIPAGIARRSRSSHSYDRFGRFAERLVRAFGMPWFLAAQTAVMVAWVATNSLAGLPHFDPYPFVFMNLVLSALAAYAAPFILLAETRQADRDRAQARAEERYHDELERRQQELLGQDNSQTQQIARLFEQDTAQTDHRGQLLERVTLLLERESDQTDVIVALGAKTVEMAKASRRSCARSTRTRSRTKAVAAGDRRELPIPHPMPAPRRSARRKGPAHRTENDASTRRGPANRASAGFRHKPNRENWRTERCSSTSLLSSW